MTMQSIRDTYDVPAKRGMVITFDGIRVVIVGASREAKYLVVKRYGSPGSNRTFPIHPTWRVEYPDQQPRDLQTGEKP